MKCKKCQQEISDGSKFCSQCGNSLEREVSDVDKITEMSRRIWYLFGLLRGRGDNGKKKQKWFIDFENHIRDKLPELWEDYEDTIKFWREHANKNSNETKLKD
jgi:hypothetical protein